MNGDDPAGQPTARRATWLTPMVATIIVALLLLAAVLLVSLEDSDDRAGHVTLVVGVIVAQIPAVFGALYAERNHRELRNGAIQEKARQGARQALADEQVTTRTGPVAEAIAAELAAVRTLLEHDAARWKSGLGGPPG